jgi:hypothetical protein
LGEERGEKREHNCERVGGNYNGKDLGKLLERGRTGIETKITFTEEKRDQMAKPP